MSYSKNTEALSVALNDTIDQFFGGADQPANAMAIFEVGLSMAAVMIAVLPGNEREVLLSTIEPYMRGLVDGHIRGGAIPAELVEDDIPRRLS